MPVVPRKITPFAELWELTGVGGASNPMGRASNPKALVVRLRDGGRVTRAPYWLSGGLG